MNSGTETGVRVIRCGNNWATNAPGHLVYTDGEWRVPHWLDYGPGDLIVTFPGTAELGSRMGRMQEWLQKKPWPLWRVGNLISDVRFLLWEARPLDAEEPA